MSSRFHVLELTLIVLLAFACSASSAVALSFAELKATPMTIQKQGVTLHGVRFGKPGAKVNLQKRALIFTHGLTSNYHEFESLIPLFVEAGYDCFSFNFRGHGNGVERSTVASYAEGDYRFEKLTDVDLPLMIEAIQDVHPGALTLIGHSMGGMVPRAAFARATITREQIASMILIGSPAHFKTAAAKPDLLGLQRNLRTYLFFGSGDEPLINFEQLRSAARLSNWLGPLAWAGNALLASSMRYQMEKELGPLVRTTGDENWSHRAMSDLTPKDIFRSFADFQIDYPYESRKVPVPVLHVVGDRDTLAPADDIVASAAIQSREAGYWIVRVKEIGHFGIVAPWVIDGYIKDALAFLKSPRLLGAKNRVISRFSPRELAAQPRTCEAIF